MVKAVVEAAVAVTEEEATAMAAAAAVTAEEATAMAAAAAVTAEEATAMAAVIMTVTMTAPMAKGNMQEASTMLAVNTTPVVNAMEEEHVTQLAADSAMG
ncbi:hypothetical protein ATO46_02140 [Aeromonas schubertii]|nr:hypothetical protein ATO46_02140 [Aeromonas schubertii]